MITIQAFLDMAKQDFKAARCLYERCLYPQAIFYLQQSVEKATKCMGLYHKIIAEEELEEIGHRSSEVYMKILRGFGDRIDRVYKLLEKFPQLWCSPPIKKHLPLRKEKLMNILNNYKKYIEKPSADLSEEKLETFLLDLKNLELDLKKLKVEKEKIGKLKQEFQEIANHICKTLSASPQSREKVISQLKSLTPELFAQLIESSIPGVICNTHLLSLSIILCPHAVSSRYPLPKRGFNPLKTYTETHPLVTKFDQLVDIMDRVLDEIPRVLSTDFEKMISSEPVSS